MARPDDPLGLEAGQGLKKFRAGAGDMGAIRARARGQARIVLDEQGDVRRGRRIGEPSDDPFGVPLRARRQARERARDVAPRQRGGEARREGVEVAEAEPRREEVKSAGGGHDGRSD